MGYVYHSKIVLLLKNRIPYGVAKSYDNNRHFLRDTSQVEQLAVRRPNMKFLVNSSIC